MNWDDSDGFCMSARPLTRSRLGEPSLCVCTGGCALATNGESPKETQNGGVGGGGGDFGTHFGIQNFEKILEFKIVLGGGVDAR